MLLSVSNDPSSQPGEILAHVEISASDDPTDLIYSHSFRYNKGPSAKDGEILVYADKESASKNVKGDVIRFDLEKCRNKDCKTKNPDGCPVIAGKGNRFLVADVFHTMPSRDTLQFFGTALFKALFSGEAGQLLRETKSSHRNGSIFLQLNDQALDAIPWEYAKDGVTFLVHTRKFARVIIGEYERPQDRLPQLPLRIVVAAPDPLDLTELKLADLHLGDQFQNLINEFHGGSIKIMLERVLPATVNKMNALLAKQNDEMGTVFHFMGHCVAQKDGEGARGLLFEDEETFQCQIAHTQNLVTIPTNLRLAFLSACDSREVARDLVQNGVRHTIGSYCPLPDDIARKSEAQFYLYLAQGLPVDDAIWRTRMYYQHNKEVRQSDYLVGAMILYSTTCQTTDNAFLYASGEIKIELNMFPNNIGMNFAPENLLGRKDQLAKLNDILRRMATRTHNSFNLCTITGIGGQGKTALAKEAIGRACHFFPGGIFVWRFDDKLEISAKNYLEGLANVLFPNVALNDYDEVENLGQDISSRFRASSLLILDHADTLKRAAAADKKDAVDLVAWLKSNISRQDISVKILATSQEILGWSGEEVVPLKGLIDSDIKSGCELFADNLNHDAKTKMKKEKTKKSLLQELVNGVDGHPLTLKLLGDAVGLPKYLDDSLEVIVREHYRTMPVDNNSTKKSLEDCFGPMIDGLPKSQRQILYLCCLFTGPIIDEVLFLVSHFINHSAGDLSAETIKTQLPKLCERGLLKLTTKIDQFSIHIALREAVRQRNTESYLHLRLPASGRYDDVFFIGAPKSLRSGEVLNWQLRKIQANMDSGRVGGFGVKYYNIVDKYRLEKDFAQHLEPFSGLVVFVRKATDPLHDDFPQFCKEKIVPIVEDKKLLFILCLKYVDAESSVDRLEKEKNTTLMRKAMETLGTCLEKTHFIIKAEPPIGILQSSSTFASTESKKSTYTKDIVDGQISEKFVGREDETSRLDQLHRAVECGDEILVESLIEQSSAKVDMRDRYGRTPLHVAAEKGHTKMLIMLAVGYRADVNIRDDSGRMPLHSAIEEGQIQIVRLLIAELGADANARDGDGVVPLHLAVKQGNDKLVAMLIAEFEANTNAKDRYNQTPLHWAVKGGQIELVKLIMVKMFPRQLTFDYYADKSVDDEGARALAEFLKQSTTLTQLDLSNNTINAKGAHALAESLTQNTTLTQLDLSLNIIGDQGACALAESLKHNTTLTELNLSCNNDIGTVGAHALAEFLKHNATLTKLDLRSNNIYTEGTLALAEALKQNTTLTQLDLSDNNIDAKGACALAESLKQNRALTQLDLSGNGINAEGACALGESLMQNTTLTQLDLSCDNIGAEGAHALAESLKLNTLTQVVLHGNKINTEGACALAESLKHNTTLTELNLSCDNIGPKGARALAESLKQNTTITQLRLYSDNIGAEGAHALAQTLKQNTTLTQLVLYGNKIDDAGACALAESLKRNTTLIWLDLPNNSIGPTGARALAESLKHNTTLTKLDLRSNGIGAVGACALAGFLKRLTRLDISDNKIDAKGALALAESLKRNKTLTQLDLSGNIIGAVGARALAECLKQNTTLTQLGLHDNNIRAEGACAVAESLKHNTTLTQLDLRINIIGAQGACALAESLKYNTTLTELNLSYNSIGRDGALALARPLAEALKQNTTLAKLDLTGNQIDASGARALAESLKLNTTLTQLRLSDIYIYTEVVRAQAGIGKRIDEKLLRKRLLIPA